MEEISNDPAAARPLKSPGDHAVILARRLDSLTSLELTPMAKAYMQDAAGMLRGIASGTISNGQSRLAQSLINAYRDLIDKKSTSKVYPGEDVLLTTIHDCASMGFSVDGSVIRKAAIARQPGAPAR